MKLRFCQRALAAAGLFALSIPAVTFAQDETVEPEPVVESRMIVAAQDSEGGMPEIQVFSTDAGGNVGMFMTEGMMVPQDVFSLANNTGVQKEIELVDDQLQQIRKINKEFSEKMSEQVKELTSGGMNPEKGAGLSKLIHELNEQKNSKMEGILLPHQFDRLRQISLQVEMKNNGEASTLAGEKIAEELGLTDEQKERLKTRSEEIKKELEEKIARLKEQAQEELLGELTREQRKKLDEMTGTKFEMQTPNLRDRVRQMRRPRESQKNDDK